MILERIYVRGVLDAASPLVVGCGEDRQTDIDLIRDAAGLPFIPATSFAGSSRHFLESLLAEPDRQVVDTVFGKREKESIQSAVLFCDALPVQDSPPTVSVRDGIRLEYETKTVGTHRHGERARGGAKYDYQVVDTGARFAFRLEAVIRDSLVEVVGQDRAYDLIYRLLTALEQGQIRVGAKTRRGLGKIRLRDVHILHLDMNDPQHVKRWLDFDWNFDAPAPVSHFEKKKLKLDAGGETKVSAEFRIPYSLLIRHYSTDPKAPDTAHLMCRGQAVIPGTSWNGALLHCIYHQLAELGFESKFLPIKEDLFGTETGRTPRASRVTVDESVIDGCESLAYTRNKVDRFTGGVVDSALFDEQPVFGGRVRLHLTVKKPQRPVAGLSIDRMVEGEVGLLILALKDIGCGIQPVGGDANIGRGILKGDTIEINGNPLTAEAEQAYLRALYTRLTGEEGENNG
jgi:CRISPR/Cas system CSM-associated protein Csm3 (group 7 of RAMP superfamily)